MLTTVHHREPILALKSMKNPINFGKKNFLKKKKKKNCTAYYLLLLLITFIILNTYLLLRSRSTYQLELVIEIEKKRTVLL